MAAVWSEDMVETLKRLWDEGKTGSEISAALGGRVSRSAVVGRAHRLGLKARPNPAMRRADMIVALRDAVTDGETISIAEAARQCGIPVGIANAIWTRDICGSFHRDQPAKRGYAGWQLQ